MELLAQQVHIVNKSSVYETEAWQMPEGTNAFLNLVLHITYEMNVENLLDLTQTIESACQRTDKMKNASRTLDIDILLFNEDILQSEKVIIPHPRLHLRRFTLLPLCEVAGDIKHPLLKLSFKDLLNQCTDICTVSKYAAAI